MKFKQIENLILLSSLLILPIIYAFIFFFLCRQKGPYWLRFNQDPDYAYLFNALAIANFESPVHIHHPGTLVHIFGAGTIWLSYIGQLIAGKTTQGINETVLTDPEFYLSNINHAVIGCTTIWLFILGFITFVVSRRILLAILVQISPLLFVKTILANEPSRVAPEAFLLFISQILVTLLIVYLFRSDVGTKKWFAINLGVVFGLGMAAKITFLPTIVFGLAIVGTRRKLLALAATMFTFLIVTLPIISQYLRLGQWIAELIIHSERYGGGDPGIPSFSTIIVRLRSLIKDDSVFFILLSILTFIGIVLTLQMIVRIVNSRLERSAPITFIDELSGFEIRRFWLTILVMISIWGQVLITINEYARSRYLISGIGLCGLVLILVVLWIECLPYYKRIIPSSTPAASLLVWVLAVSLSFQQFLVANEKISNRVLYALNEVQEVERITHHTSAYQGCIVALNTRASTIPSALYYGNSWVNGLFSDVLNSLYPDSVFVRVGKLVNSRTLKFYRYEKRIPTITVFANGNNCVLLRSKSKLQGNRIQEDVADYTIIENLLPDQVETVYRIHYSRT